MYGWLHECFKCMVVSLYGMSVWEEIRQLGLETSSCLIHDCYPDTLMWSMVRSLSDVVSISERNALEMFGCYFVQFLREKGYDKLLRHLGKTLFEYINGVNTLHRHLRSSVPNMKPPEIWCEMDTRSGRSDFSAFFMHYKSVRGALLHPFLKGLVTTVAKTHFSKVLSMTLLNTQGVDGCEESIWYVEEIDDILESRNSGVSETVDVGDLIVDLGACQQELDGCGGSPSPDESELEVSIDSSAGGVTVDSASLIAHEFINCDDEGNSQSSSRSQCKGQWQSLCPSVEGFETQSTSSTFSSSRTGTGLGLSFSQFRHLFPYHVVFNCNYRIIQFGPRLKELVPSIVIGADMDALFAVNTPHCSWDKKWDAMEAILSCNPQFELESLARTSKINKSVRLSGPIAFSADGTFASFLSSPDIRYIDELCDHGISVTDLAQHGSSLDIVLQDTLLKNAMETNRRLMQLTNEVRVERENSVRLMKEIADKANEALAVKMTFVRYVSHEMRTPLTIAKLGLTLVEKSVLMLQRKMGDQPEDVVHEIDDTLVNVADCEQSLDVSVSILDDLLSYEKMESGIYEVFCRMCLGVKFVEDCVHAFGVQAKQKNIQLIFENNIPISLSDILYFNIDTKKMSQVVRNFVSSALKFTPTGGHVTISVSVRLDLSEEEMHSMFEAKQNSKALASTVRDVSSDDYYEIYGVLTVGFADSGIGMEQDDQEKLFNQIIHFSPDELQAGGGSGLGLWIAHSIVQMHHGRVYLHSDGMGSGCTFFVDIPAYRYQQDRKSASSDSKGMRSDDDEDSGRSPPTPPTSPTSPCHHRKSTRSAVPRSRTDIADSEDIFDGFRILIVDDAHLIRKLISRILSSRGSICTTAENGQEAVDIIQARMLTGDHSNRFDCILMDFVMPVMDGPSAARAIRQLGFIGPIVGVTGNMMNSDVAHFRRCGATVVLPKPLLLPDLEKFLRNVKSKEKLSNIFV